MKSDLERNQFGERLKSLRASVGYTQSEMAHALGIRAARYAKYEIGRSEAPYEILVRLSKLFDVDLNHLIVGEPISKPSHENRVFPKHFKKFIEILPTAAVIYDAQRRLVSHNQLYLQTFFKECPSLVRLGTPQEFILRAWANASGLDSHETEEFVQSRLTFNGEQSRVIQMDVGNDRLHIAGQVSTRIFTRSCGLRQ